MSLGLRISDYIKISLIASVAISLGIFAGVQAGSYKEPIYGRMAWVGYFNGVLDSDNGAPVLSGGIPTAVDSANDFMYLIQTTNYKNGSTQNKIGAAFIVKTILGKKAPGGGATVSDEEWTAFFNILKEREQAGKLKFNVTVNNAGENINSYYQKDQQDDAFYTDYRSGQGMQIINDDGTMYQLRNACANPLGDLVPPKVVDQWAAKPEVSVAAYAMPGETVVWTHKTTIINGVSDKNVTNSWKNSSGFGAGSGTFGTITKPANPGVSNTGTSSYVVQPGDVGKDLCRTTVAIVVGGTNVESAPDCVRIGSPVSSGACRPIKISATSPQWSSSRGLSYRTRSPGGSPAGNELITTTVNVYMLDAGGNKSGGAVFSKSVTNGNEISDVQLTTRCTTGDRYVVEYSTTSYTYNVLSEYYPDTMDCGRYNNRPCNNAYTTYSGETRSDSWQTQIGPCFDYLLKPGVMAMSNYQIEVDSVVTVNPSIVTDSWTKNKLASFWNTYRTQSKSKATQWQVSKVTVGSNVAIPTPPETEANTDPCVFYKSKGFAACSSIANGSDSVFNSNRVISGSNALSSITNKITDEPAGSKICYVFSVKSSNGENSNESTAPNNVWVHSAISSSQCVIVVKKPKVQVLGGDLSVGKGNPSGGDIATTTSVKSFGSSYVFGSWAEYGVLANGSVIGFGSASAFNGGMLGSNVSSNCQYSRLTFNNGCSGSTSTSSLGNYNFGSQTVPDISTAFPTDSRTQVLPSNVGMDYFNNSSSVNVFTSSGDLTISGGTLAKGRWAVINAPNSTVTISGDIEYTLEKLRSVNDIPQLVIIARNINIQGTVTQVDAWLIARDGYVNTCSDVSIATNLTTNICRRPLVVNGPLVAKSLYLRRTFGSDPGMAMSGYPAEKLNLRADAHLWAYARSTGTGRVWTVYTTNVPPRL